MSDALTLIGKGIMPFMGGMRKFMPYLYAQARAFVPEPWDRVQFNDMTCGSASGAALFRFHGMRTHANDLSLRSYISASAVFGGRRLDLPMIGWLCKVCAARPAEMLVPEGKTPAEQLPNIAKFLHPGACRVFDALYYAAERGDVYEDEGPGMRYMALRWVLLNKTFMYFLKLPTDDLAQLEIQGEQWAKLVKILRDPSGSLQAVARDVNHLIAAMPRTKPAPTVSRGDCREMIKAVDFGEMSITNLNPPTAGNAVFMQSNKVLDTLLFNVPQDLADDDMPGDLWRSIILDTGQHVPSGHFIFSFCGDGTLSWDEGMRTWEQLGEVVNEWKFPWHGDAEKLAGLVLIRRR